MAEDGTAWRRSHVVGVGDGVLLVSFVVDCCCTGCYTILMGAVIGYDNIRCFYAYSISVMINGVKKR